MTGIAACGPAPRDEASADAAQSAPEELVPRRLPPPPVAPTVCTDIHAEDAFPTFDIRIDPSQLRKLEEDFRAGVEKWRPLIAFRSGEELITDAVIRLRGNNSRCWGKMQFAIAFHRVDKEGHFRGLRRINLDHGGCQLMEERLALAFLRDLGLPAPCANHARLVINGTYYGVFTNLEHVNEDFLARSFEGDGGGNLFKDGLELRTNEEDGDLSRLNAYQKARDLAGIDALVDLDEAVAAWAAEAVLPALDNYWLHGRNYYLYDHPARGFLFIPADMDQALPLTDEFVKLPTLFPATMQHPADVVLADPVWRAKYVGALRAAIAAFDADRLDARLETWWWQIREAAAADPHHVYTRVRLDYVKAQIRARAEWLRTFNPDAYLEMRLDPE